EIEIAILAIDFDNRRITLGHKQIERNPWESFHEEYGLKTEVDTKVTKVTDKGVFVSLPHELEGFIPASKTEAGGDLSEHFAIGDETKAYVIEFNEGNKNITLSQREADLDKAGAPSRKPKAQPAAPEAPQTGTPTLGEMSGLADLQKEMKEREKREA